MTEQERYSAVVVAMDEIGAIWPAGVGLAGVGLAEVRVNLSQDLRLKANDAYLGLEHAWRDARQVVAGDERFNFCLAEFRRRWIEVAQGLGQPTLPGMTPQK